MRKLVTSLAILIFGAGVVRAQWTMQESHTKADLRGIHNVGNGVAWASGTNGTVLRTLDDGATWTACAVPPDAEKLDFRGVQAFDADTAIVMSSGKGDLSRLYKTTDGCKSWKLVFKNPDKEGFWDALRFDRPQSGWLLGDPVNDRFTLFSSHDRGQTWRGQHHKGLDARAAIQGAFAASNSSMEGMNGGMSFGTGGTEGAFIYSVTEVGICLDDCSPEDVMRAEQSTKWARVAVPIGDHSEASGIFSLAEIHDPGNSTWFKASFVAVGGNYTKPDDSYATAAFTSDGEKSWIPAQTFPHGYRSAVAYDEATKTWITVGPNGTDISTDDGRNWRAAQPNAALHETPDADRNWNALSLPFVVGPHGRIGKLDSEVIIRLNNGK